MTSRRILFLRIEPAGYILALLRALRDLWPGEIDAQFISTGATQAWDFDGSEIGVSVLPVGNAKGKAAVRAMISERPPDLVHAAGWGAPACWAAITSAKSAGIPVVVDHDTWADAASGAKALVKRLVLPWMLRRVTHFAPGGSRQAAFLRRYGVSDAQITPINMTVDVVAIQRYLEANPGAGIEFRRAHGLPEDAQIVLFLARLVPRKGLEDLLEAWSKLMISRPDVLLVIAGDGPLRADLERKVPLGVSFVGRLAGPEVWHAYAAADIFVAPSRREPWGLTINEAMAAGLPVVMTDAFGCIGDLAVADETACIVPASQPEKLKAGIEKVLDDDAYRIRLLANAKRLIAMWTIEEEARRIVAIWLDLLEGRAESLVEKD